MTTDTSTSFVADGPTLIAFQTAGNNTGIVFGVNAQGTRAGVYGESVPGPQGAGRDSDIDGVGVCGKGSHVGVYGQGNHGDAGVLGTHNGGKAGVVGAVMRGGVGVAGLSVDSLGNPAGLVQNLSSDFSIVDGTGVLGVSGLPSPKKLDHPAGVIGSSAGEVGVAGTSDISAGVFGTSIKGNGGEFSAISGIGVRATSQDDRGAVFESKEIAQLGLLPADSQAGHASLPRGETGDLYVRHIPGVAAPKNHAEIFFCLGKNVDGRSLWVPLTLGAAVLGA